MTATTGRAWADETIPVLRVDDIVVALAWYQRLGFREEWQHRFEPGLPVFACVSRDQAGTGARIFLSEHTGDGEAGSLVYLRVSDIEPIAAEFGTHVHENDGRLEVALQDPFGNRIRVGCPSGKGRGPGYTFPDSQRS